jgi:hypothetical protein
MENKPIFSHPTKYRDVDISLMVEGTNLDHVLQKISSNKIIDNPELKKLWTEARSIRKKILKLLPDNELARRYRIIDANRNRT